MKELGSKYQLNAESTEANLKQTNVGSVYKLMSSARGETMQCNGSMLQNCFLTFILTCICTSTCMCTCICNCKILCSCICAIIRTYNCVCIFYMYLLLEFQCNIYLFVLAVILVSILYVYFDLNWQLHFCLCLYCKWIVKPKVAPAGGTAGSGPPGPTIHPPSLFPDR